MKTRDAHYYKVALALPATWRENIFTYQSGSALSIGQPVVAPFGKAKHNGYVVSLTTKPDHETKPVLSIDNTLPLLKQSLDFANWLKTNYPLVPGLHVQHLLPKHIQGLGESFETTDQSAKSKASLPKLTEIQRRAVDKLRKDKTPQVLHGVTGSGKTRVYLELIADVLKSGSDVLLLFPEISLSSQLKNTVMPYFPPNSVHTYHSTQSKTEQKRTWQAAQDSTGGNIFLGPRSALFLPFRRLGLVVVDEAHDGSYKEDNGSRYNGLMVAAALAKSHSAKLILGSATPPVQETYLLQAKQGSVVCMHSLATKNTAHERELKIVSMTDADNRSSIPLISKPLLASIEQTLGNGHQSLLFLNRRGTARSVMCENCGWHAVCKSCDAPLTYHHDDFRMRCHLCGQSQQVFTACPQCRSVLSQKALGVKSLEQALKARFPEVNIARFDSDNKKSETFSERFEEVHSGKAQILIGTQLITKGLDLPLLETVGVLQAEASLLLPDYSSNERTFQQLLQVSGRVGRGHIPGRVFVQSYNPKSELLKAVTSGDWHSFYKSELEQRNSSGFPPFRFALKLWVKNKDEDSARLNLEKFLAKVRATHRTIKILGPAPSFYSKSGGLFVWQIVLLSPSRSRLLEVLQDLPKNIYFDLDPVSLL